MADGTVSIRTERAVAWMLLLGAAVLAAFLFFANRRFYEDDALISLRYCQNLLDGKGLCWNPGERVEGYTNFLYIVLVAALGALHVDLTVASRLVGAFAYVGIVIALFFYTGPERRQRFSALSMFPVVITMTSCPIIVWTLGGLEAPLCAFLAVAGAAIVARNLSVTALWPLAAAGVFFALATMTRIDASLFMPPAVLCLLLFNRTRRGLVGAGVVSAAFISIYAPYFAWRYSYYGDLLPNTFYAKGTSVDGHTLYRGVRYVIGAFLRPPATGLWIVILLLVAGKRALGSPRLVYLTASVLAYTVFPIFAGGDHMPASRFMVPAVPVIALVVYEGLVLTRVAETRVRVQALGALLLLACVAQWPFGMLNPVHADPAVFLGLRVGEYARSHFPAGSVVGINAAGAVPYVAKDLRFIDMLGLNDRHIAHRDTPHSDLPKAQIPGHRKGDGAYVLSRRPDFIILGPPEGTTVEVPWWVTDYEIRERRPMFEQLYRKEEVDLDVQTLPDHESFPVSATGTIHFVYYRLVEPVELRKQG